jgi:hypothetical protein
MLKSTSKKLAPNNFAPLKLACLGMDWNRRKKIKTQSFHYREINQKQIKREEIQLNHKLS